ncbi:MAG: ribosome maturation factor RimM [Paludibacteraceae bacterium]|nr:ribosome maturation factor RimM [Paludibacteraceae bacterium]
MITENEILHIGTIRRAHGTQGELQCTMLNDYFEESDTEFIILRLDNIFVPFRVTDWRSKGAEDLLFRLQGVDTEMQVQRLIGAEAYMLRKDISEEQASNVTWQDLVGYQVLDTSQGELGRVVSVDDSTANILLTLSGKQGEVLIPIHEDFIVKLLPEKQTLSITLPYQL